MILALLLHRKSLFFLFLWEIGDSLFCKKPSMPFVRCNDGKKIERKKGSESKNCDISSWWKRTNESGKKIQLVRSNKLFFHFRKFFNTKDTNYKQILSSMATTLSQLTFKKCMYSQTCGQRPDLGPQKRGRLTEVSDKTEI